MKSLKEYMVKEDKVDAMKHEKFNDIFQALEKLNSEYDELDYLDRDENSTGIGDLTDQLTTMRKHIKGLYMVLDRMDKVVPMDAQDRAGDEYRDVKRISDSVNEEDDMGGHPTALLMKVVKQMQDDAAIGDYTAIDDLLKDIPRDQLEGFLSEVGESKDLDNLKKLAGI